MIIGETKWAIYAPSEEDESVWVLKGIYNTRGEAKNMASIKYDKWIVESFELSASDL